MDKSRERDLEVLRQDYKRADSQTRVLIEKTAQRIRREDGKIKSMRESLIKEHRKGNTENIKDIHDIVSKNKEYQNE